MAGLSMNNFPLQVWLKSNSLQSIVIYLTQSAELSLGCRLSDFASHSHILFVC